MGREKHKIRIRSGSLEEGVENGTKLSAAIMFIVEYKGQPNILFLRKVSADDKNGTLVFPGGGRKNIKSTHVSTNGILFKSNVPETPDQTANREAVEEMLGVGKVNFEKMNPRQKVTYWKRVEKKISELGKYVSNIVVDLLPQKRLEIFTYLFNFSGDKAKEYLNKFHFDKEEVSGIYLVPLKAFREAPVEEHKRYFRKDNKKQIFRVDGSKFEKPKKNDGLHTAIRGDVIEVGYLDKKIMAKDCSLIIGEAPHPEEILTISYALEAVYGLVSAEASLRKSAVGTKVNGTPRTTLSTLGKFTATVRTVKSELQALLRA